MRPVPFLVGASADASVRDSRGWSKRDKLRGRGLRAVPSSRDDAEQSRDMNDAVAAPPGFGGRGELRRGPAPSFHCPLTMALMRDPVQDREGNSYEKGAIMKWLSGNNSSPVTRNILRRKHLVPNRALKEAIEFEVTRQNEMDARTAASFPPSKKAPSRSKSAISSLASKSLSAKKHHQVINHVLSSLKIKSRLDDFGIAFLPMNKLRPTINDEPIDMLMVVDAPPARETFRLYTHFDVSLERQRRRVAVADPSEEPSSNEGRVFRDLLRRGRHGSLTLAPVGEGRARFGLDGKATEIRSDDNFVAVLNMFVEVSFRVRRRIRA